jgi:hypothetical protein
VGGENPANNVFVDGDVKKPRQSAERCADSPRRDCAASSGRRLR